MSSWIRLNIDWDDSEWVFEMSGLSRLSWITLLCHTRKTGTKGRTKRLSYTVAAKRWGVGANDVEKMEQAALADGALLIEDDEWVIVNWNVYQKVDTTNAKRQARFKESRKVTAVTALPTVTLARDPDPDPDPDSSGSTGEAGAPPAKKAAKNNPKIEGNVAKAIAHLNAVAGRKFTATGGQAPPARARLKEGATIEQLNLVTDHRAAMWLNDGRMSPYVRPETVFARSHWESYLFEAEKWHAEGRKPIDQNGQTRPEELPIDHL